jgi:hypothetical protein
MSGIKYGARHNTLPSSVENLAFYDKSSHQYLAIRDPIFGFELSLFPDFIRLLVTLSVQSELSTKDICSLGQVRTAREDKRSADIYPEYSQPSVTFLCFLLTCLQSHRLTLAAPHVLSHR